MPRANYKRLYEAEQKKVEALEERARGLQQSLQYVTASNEGRNRELRETVEKLRKNINELEGRNTALHLDNTRELLQLRGENKRLVTLLGIRSNPVVNTTADLSTATKSTFQSILARIRGVGWKP
jgi:hypothetical protein